MEKAAIIGYGKLGSHLYHALKKSGKYSIGLVVKSSRSSPGKNALKDCSLIFITVNDSNITRTARTISRLPIDFRDKIVFHTSGALTAEILSPLIRKGASAASFHPVQTFEKKAVKKHTKFEKIYIAVEGQDKAVKKAFEVAKHIGSNPFVLSPGDKVLHHINCVIASNYLVSYINKLSKLNERITGTYRDKWMHNNGFKKGNFFSIYKPLIEQTLENIRTKGTKASLTGPIQRKDVQTIKVHLEKLRKELPEVLNFYSYMGIETVRLAVKNKYFSSKEGEKLIRLFKRSNIKGVNK